MNKTITIKIPEWIKRKKVLEDINKLLEEKYGVASVTSIRKQFKIKNLRENIEVDENEVIKLREKEKKRIDIQS